MSISFSADEVLAVAEQVERNGDRFYHVAAERAADVAARQMFLKLAAMEDTHLEAFADMRAGLTEAERKPVTFDPYDEDALYLKAMADRTIFDVAADPTAKLSGRESEEEVIGIGIQAEKDSIVFYTGLRDLIPVHIGRSRIDAIIKEELGHFATLSEMLADLRA